MIKLKKIIDIKNVRYLLFIDTETIGNIAVKESCLPFEIGAKVYDKELDQVVFEKSYLVRKFFNNKFIMLSTFSATKYPQYKDMVVNDNRYKTYSVADIAHHLEKVIQRYGIKIMVAHNAKFDVDALERLFNEFEVENPFRKLDYLDTLEISKVITYSKAYTLYCLDNKDVLNSLNESAFITNGGRVRTTAQAIYSYITLNPNWQEAHTGLQDIDNEIDIFKYSLNLLGNTLVQLNYTPTFREWSVVNEEEEN